MTPARGSLTYTSSNATTSSDSETGKSVGRLVLGVLQQKVLSNFRNHQPSPSHKSGRIQRPLDISISAGDSRRRIQFLLASYGHQIVATSTVTKLNGMDADVEHKHETKLSRFCVRFGLILFLLAVCSFVFLLAFRPWAKNPPSRPFSCTVNVSNMTMGKTNTTERLRQLRRRMKEFNISAYIVPTDDAHQNEYIAAADQRREFISGFTGSAGTAIITEHNASLWTDGRYFLQAAQQLDDNWTLMKDRLPDTPTFGQFLNDKLAPQSSIGADPTTISNSTWETISKELEINGSKMVNISTNLVDLVWSETGDRPAPPNNSVWVLEQKYTGKDWKQKIQDVREKMAEKKAEYLVVTALDEIAWLLNMRGSDIPFNPVFFSYVIVGINRTMLFINESKVNSTVRRHLNIEENRMDTGPMDGVELYPYGDVFDKLDEIVHPKDKKLWLTPESSYAVCSRVTQDLLVRAASPIALMKAVKNEAELAGMYACHVRDGVALAEFFAWMEAEVPKCNVTELSAADKLEELRSQQENYVSLSFDTISASGPNGAIIHYKPTPESSIPVTSNDMFLLDSGSQYLDGTTDVTRTVHFGQPNEYQKECYTRVLKGNLAMAMNKFPEKATGERLDSFARQHLWNVGLDYAHGTGHGVGAGLNVHEGPMSIGYRHNPKDPGLLAGMVITDEPGYYEAGAFGIRIENQMAIEKAQVKYGNGSFLELRNLTLVPYQRKLLVPELLNRDEIAYINQYHETCLQHVGKALQDQNKKEAYRWLLKEAAPIG